MEENMENNPGREDLQETQNFENPSKKDAIVVYLKNFAIFILAFLLIKSCSKLLILQGRNIVSFMTLTKSLFLPRKKQYL